MIFHRHKKEFMGDLGYRCRCGAMWGADGTRLFKLRWRLTLCVGQASSGLSRILSAKH